MLVIHNLIAFCTLFFSVASCWSITQGGVAVVGSGDAGERVKIEQLTSPVELIAGRTLDIAFKIPEAPPLPHQIVVRISPSGAPVGSVDKEFLTKPRQKNVQTIIPFKQIPAALHNRNLDVSIFISGGSGEPFTTKLFDLVVYGDDDTVTPSAAPVQSVGAGSKLAPLPEIIYTRRPDPRHVNPVIALVFVGAIDALFGIWLLALGGDVGSFASALSNLSPSQSVMALSVLSVELLFVAYFISWSIFRVIAVGALLLPIVYLSGRHAVPI